MKKKYSRILGVALSLMLVASLFGFAAPVSAADVSWSVITNPGDALHEGLNLADVEVGPIAVTPDGGTVFAAVNCEAAIVGVSATATAGVDDWALLQSTDGGHNWTATGLINNPGSITGIAVSSNFATDNTMYVAAGSVPLAPAPAVFRSQDSGTTFVELKGVPNDANTNVTNFIFAIDMYPASPYPYIMVGTNTDVWVLQDAPFGIWRDQEVNAAVPINVVDVAFAPDFATTNYTWAVTRTGLVTSTNSPGAWGTISGHGGVLSLPAINDQLTITATAVNTVYNYYVSNGAAAAAIVPGSSVGAVVVGNTITLPVVNDAVTITATAVNTTFGRMLVAGNALVTITANVSGNVSGMVASADIGFPDDYNSLTAPYCWVATNAVLGTGGVFRVRGLLGVSQSIQQLFATDIRSIAVSGSTTTATILAGLQNTATILMSLNGGVMWITPVQKQPTGVNTTYVIMAPDFATSRVAYVGTSDGSGAGTGEPAASAAAFQVTHDGGVSWNQTGLIDTVFAVINDIAVVGLDDIFVVSDSYSLWKIADASSRSRMWERILTSATVTFPMHALANIRFVETSPEFATDLVVYATDNNIAVVRSNDGGNIFAPMGSPGGAITVMHVLDATFAFTGAVGQVYRTDDGGYSWLPAITPPGAAPNTVTSIAIAPNYDTSGRVLVGSQFGFVYMSEDRGATFAMVAGAPVGIGFATPKYVAFEPTYTGAGHPGPVVGGIYAAGGNIIQRYYTPGVGWETIDDTIPGEIAAVTAVPADAFTILEPAAAAEAGTISVTGGSVTVSGSSATTTPAAGAPVVVAAGGSTAWAVTAVAGEFITVTSTTANAAGVWTRGANAVAGIAIDVDFDASVAATGGAYRLPDIAVAAAGAAGASVINGLLTSPDGTLYGSNVLAGQGVERSLNPTASALSAFATGPDEGTITPVFESVATAPAYALASLMGMWLVVDETLTVTGSKNVLFTIDTIGSGTGPPPGTPGPPSTWADRILTYTDTLATEIVAISPENEAMVRETEVQLSWEELTGALSYVWQLAEDDLFTVGVLQGEFGYTGGTVTGLRAGVEYYWRVRVDDLPDPAVRPDAPGNPLLSRWSEIRTFVTGLGERPWSPVLTNVQAVHNNQVPLKPGFEWTGADWATGYEFVLADNASLTSPLVSTTVSTTAYGCTVELKYSTAYFWQVRAVSATSDSEWSDVGTFTSMAEPVEATPPVVIQEVPDIIVEPTPIEVPPAVEATPTWALLVIIIIGAVLVCSVIILIMRTRRPI